MRQTPADGVTHASELRTNVLEMREYITYFLSRDDEAFVKAHGKRKAFHKGGNSSCRLHIHQHYDLYKEKCLKADIPENHWCLPRSIWKEKEQEKEAIKTGKMTEKQAQQILDFKAVTGPREFTREGVLHAVAKLIATNDQVSC